VRILIPAKKILTNGNEIQTKYFFELFVIVNVECFLFFFSLLFLFYPHFSFFFEHFLFFFILSYTVT